MHGCDFDEYQRGLADGRKVVEAELAAERHALSMLANALGDVITDATLHLSPCDAARLDSRAVEIPVVADRRLRSGTARLRGSAA